LFAFSYANTPVIRAETSLDRLPSTRDRSSAEFERLGSLGRGVAILQLQGYLFFGTSEQVVDRVRKRAESGPHRLRSVVLDFSKVANVDSASANALRRINLIAERHGFRAIVCGLVDPIRQTLSRCGVAIGGEGPVTEAETLDLALEREEDALLAESKDADDADQVRDTAKTGDEAARSALLARLPREDYAAGAVVLRSGDPADRVLFIESGRVAVRRRSADERYRRLRTMQAGAVVGEVAFFLSGRRTADVVAEAPTVVRVLRAEDIARLEQTDPRLVIAGLKLLGESLAEKVVVANRMTDHIGQ
jgi:sulfate permease, SulP family